MVKRYSKRVNLVNKDGRFILQSCGFYLVEAKHLSENPASGRVMEKAGMHKEAVLRKRMLNKVTKDLDDVVIYSITKDEL